jgi:hypothetical protein
LRIAYIEDLYDLSMLDFDVAPMIVQTGLPASAAAAPATASLARKGAPEPPSDQEHDDSHEDPNDDLFGHGHSILANACTE